MDIGIIKKNIIKKDNFAVAYISFLCLNMIPIFNITFISRILLAFFAIWSFVILIENYFFHGLVPYKERYIIILLLMFTACFVSYLINFRVGGLQRIIKLYFFGVAIFLLYAQIPFNGSGFYNYLKKLCKIFASFVFVCNCVSYIFFLFSVSFTITNREGITVRLGFLENRLFGVFSSPNVGGTFSVIAIFMLAIAYTIESTEKRRKHPYRFYVCCLVSNLIYLSLSLSRGSYLGLTVAICVFFFICRLPKYFESASAFKKFVVRVCLIIVLSATLFSVFALCRNLLSNIPLLFDHMNVSSTAAEGDIAIESQPRIDFERMEKGRNIDISNKRFSIWKASLDLFRIKGPLGTSDPYASFLELDKAQKNMLKPETETYIIWSKGNIHNGYLQMLIECGYPAFILFFVFLLLCLTNVTRYLRNNTDDHKTYLIFCLSFCIVSYLLLNNLVETNIVLMGANSFQAVFWLIAGIVIQICTKRGAGDRRESYEKA